jgi:hypothetical protein
MHDPSNRYLGLMGVAFDKDIYKGVHDDLENLKKTHFNYDPDNPIILHRKEILYRQGIFKVLQDPERKKAFNNDLINFFYNLKCVLFLVVIDKKYHIEKYGKRAYHPYHFILKAMMERYCGYLNFFNHRGDIMAESRKKEEDMSLKNAYIYVYDNGTEYYSSSFFQKVLTSKEIKIKSKDKNIAGLQIADLLAYPCKKDFLIEKGRLERKESGFGEIICEYIKDKYNMQIFEKRVDGYGKVFLG